MKFRARILVSLKEGVLDTQGKAVLVSLKNLGFDSVEEVRIGKSIHVVLSAVSPEEAKERVESMCEALLVNPLIETGMVSLEAIG
jgi:phosphoribosylformylglycinamidine synthase PurS subunit